MASRPVAAEAPRVAAGRRLQLDAPMASVRLGFWGTVLFLVAPLVIILAVSLTPGRFMLFPPPGLSLRWYGQLFHSPEWVQAIRTSLAVGVLSALLATSVGFSLALGLARFRARTDRLLFGLGLLPLFLPPVVVGVAYVSFFYQLGINDGFWKLVLSHALFNAPFPFVLIYSALARIDPALEEAAMNLGADENRVWFTITLPLVRSDVFAGTLFAFILSLNEYIVAFLVTAFTLVTFPIQILASVRYSYSPIIAVASVLFIALTAAVVYVADRLTGGLWD